MSPVDQALVTGLLVLVSCLALAAAYGFWAFGQRLAALEARLRIPNPLPPGSPEHLTTVFRPDGRQRVQAWRQG